MRAWTPILALFALGCIRPLDLPFLGDCADYPSGVFTYGEVGIGTCLSGPADAQFLEQDGRTWLAVSNADPYLNFASGSVLLVDWEAVDFDRRVNLLHELPAAAQPTERFNGQFAWLPHRDLILVTNRFSEGAVTRVQDDQGFVIDVSDPLAPSFWETRPEIGMRDDPYLVQVDEEARVAYVGNLTHHTISLFDIDDERLRQVHISPKTEISDAIFIDDDESGSLATLESIQIIAEDFVAPDQWTLTYVDKLVRMWVPTPNVDGDPGLVRWTSGDIDFTPAGLGIEIDPADSPVLGEIRDPLTVTEPGGRVVLFYADGGVIQTLDSGAAIGDWTAGRITPFTGSGTWDAFIGGPAPTLLSPTMSGLYYHGRSAPGAAASIGLAQSDDGITYGRVGAPVLTDPAGLLSFEQPYVRADAITNNFRMWMSVWDGAQWTIGLTESLDGATWGPVEEVVAFDGGHAAAPVVTYLNGRYLMWLTVGDGTFWDHAAAWSYDGRTWFDVVEVVQSELPFDLAAPPRVAVQADPTGSWRMEGRDEGMVGALVVAGARFITGTQGLSLLLASGHDVPNALLPANRSVNGLIPGSVATVGGRTTLYVTGVGLDGRERIGAIREVGDSWSVLETDIIPSGVGGNVAGVSSPVVVERDGVYTMFYAATAADGVQRIRRATSTDGRAFVPVPGLVIQTEEDWDDAAQLPHSVESLGNGRIRLWYAGNDGNRFRIGAATANSPQGAFSPDPGPTDAWHLGAGPLGSFDDTGVKDPMVFVAEDGTTQMYYAGFDGQEWHIGHAVRQNGGWVRRTERGRDISLPAMSGQLTSFSSLGVDNPVLGVDTAGDPVLWYSGTDGVIRRLGRAIPEREIVFAAQRFPTPGDRLVFTVTPGGEGWENIRLAQSVADFQTTGVGMSSMTLDPERGFLYVTSKLANFVYVIDVRDDTSGAFNDANYRDIETLIRVQSRDTPLGFRNSIVDPIRDRLYLTSREPDGIVVVDLNELQDNDRKDVTHEADVHVFPLLSMREDAGVPTWAQFGGDGMALTPDGRLLLVTHLRGNALYVFDLEVGAYGEQVAFIPHVGENPHMVRISPDGMHAVIVNYLGDVDQDGLVSSTLAVVDLDPTSPTYLEVVTWLANR